MTGGLMQTVWCAPIGQLPRRQFRGPARDGFRRQCGRTMGSFGFDYSTSRMFVFGATEGAGQSDRASKATQKGNANASGTTGDR